CGPGNEPPISAFASTAGFENPALPLDAEGEKQRAPIKTTTTSNRFLQVAAACGLARRRTLDASIFDRLSFATRTARWLAFDSDSSLIRRRCLKRSRRRFPSRFFQMIQLLPQLNILLAYQPVDFRKGIDGLIGLCRAQFDAELYDGTLYVFRNRRGTALKVLCFDGIGWWLVIRRFSQGRLQWWPKAQADTLTHPLEAQQLQVLLYNGLPEQASFASPWRALRPAQAARATSSSTASPL